MIKVFIVLGNAVLRGSKGNEPPLLKRLGRRFANSKAASPLLSSQVNGWATYPLCTIASFTALMIFKTKSLSFEV